MANDAEDLVSNVRVTGTQESEALLAAYADAGAASFEKLGAAAKKSSSDVAAGAAKVKNAAADAQKSAENLGKVKFSFGSGVADLKQIENGMESLVRATGKAIPALAQFVSRIATLGAGAVAAGVGILKLASSVAKSADTQENATDKATQTQIDFNNSLLASQQSSIQYAASQRQLTQQLNAGTISYSDYQTQLKKLSSDYQDQIIVASQLEAAQKAVADENARLTKQAADKKAFDALIDTWGGPMLSALTSLGRAADRTFTSFKNAFGPGVASALGLIEDALNKNSGAISKFFSDAGTKLQNFINQNGPAIQKAFVAIGQGIDAAFTGIIAALPGLLSFFNDQLVPAVQSFASFLGGVATTINSVFGTELTAGGLAIILIVGQLTGAFKLLITTIRVFFSLGSIIAGLPFGPVILAVVAAIGLLLIVFPQLRTVALEVLNSIIETFKGMVGGATAAVQGVIDAFTAITIFLAKLFARIVDVFKQGWLLVTASVGVVVDAIKAAWNGTVAFFSDIASQIGQFFTDLGNSIVQLFQDAINGVINIFNDLVAKGQAILQPLLDLLSAIASLAGAALGGGSNGQTGQVATFSGGGGVRGPGSWTSDSIPAWLSNGEFVIKAQSVAKYGMGLLSAINSGRFQVPKFNTGGLVRGMIGAMPRVGFADGGAAINNAASMRPLSLTLMGETFDGLFAPEDVGERLTKFAVARQNKSSGRKPAWLGAGR